MTQDETKLGDIMRKDCVLRFKRKGRVAAAASIFRDLESPTIVVAAMPPPRGINLNRVFTIG